MDISWEKKSPFIIKLQILSEKKQFFDMKTWKIDDEYLTHVKKIAVIGIRTFYLWLPTRSDTDTFVFYKTLSVLLWVMRSLRVMGKIMKERRKLRLLNWTFSFQKLFLDGKEVQTKYKNAKGHKFLSVN